MLLALLFVRASAYSPRQRWEQAGSLLKYKVNPAYCASVREGKHGDGADVILWHCGPGKEFQWTFDGPYVRYSAAPEYCLSVREGRAGDGSDVILWRCDDEDAFRWRYEDGHMKFAVEPRYWLSVREDKVSDGADLILWRGHAAGFLWSVHEPAIKLKADPSLCLLRASLATELAKSGTSSEERRLAKGQVVLRPCEQGGWAIVGDQIQALEERSSCLGVRDSLFQDDQPVTVRPCEQDAALAWKVDLEGRIRVKSRPDYCLMVHEPEAGDGFLDRGVLGAKIRHCDAHEPEGVSLQHNREFHDRYELNAFSQVWVYEQEQLKLKADTRYCATVREGLVENGHGLIMWHCEGAGGLSATQSRWTLDGSYLRLTQDPRFCASVREGLGGDGSDVILWTCGTGPSFRWTVAPLEAGVQIAWAADPKYHLSVRGGELSDGADLILWSGYGNPYAWRVQLPFIRLAVDPQLCLSVREGRAGDGSDLILWRCPSKGGAHGWTLEGERLHYAADPRFCASVREGAHSDGADIILWTCSGDRSQQWTVDGERLRLKAHPNYCLTVREGRAGDGSDIILWDCDVSIDVDGEL